MEHLHPKAAEIALKTDKERILSVNQEKWIGYTGAEEILLEMEALLDYPTCSRMPGLLLVGETNNGKTALLNKFLKNHPIYRDENQEGLTVPVVKVQAPPLPDEKRFYNNILDSLQIPFRINDKVEQKHRQIVHVMKAMNVKLLLIDEIHHVLAGSPTKQRAFLNIIKYLANDLSISIVCAGTKDARAAIGIEPQLANRIEPIDLPKWSMDKEYIKLLSSFERILPLQKPSNLHSKDIAMKILVMSEGKLGEISTIIKRSAEVAIKDGSEKISPSTLDKIRYVSPDSRRTARR